MNITPSDQKPGINNGPKMIGFWKGSLLAVNPSAKQLQEIYELDELPEEPVYQGKNKENEDWAMLSLIFQEEINKIPVPYRIFISKEVAEFEKDGVKKAWYLNQHGQSQIVADKKDLFRSITHLQKWNKDEKKMEDVLDENDKPVELTWRKAYKGEKQLYDLLRKLVTQDWFQATAETSLFIKIDALMRGKVDEISTWINTENYESVVGMVEISSKDGENGVNHYQNCVDGAWMKGYKIKEANMTTAIDGWKKYEDKANGKGKNKEIYEFYQAVKRNKNTTEFTYLHQFDPEAHIASGTATIKHSGDDVDMDY